MTILWPGTAERLRPGDRLDPPLIWQQGRESQCPVHKIALVTILGFH